MYFNYVKQHIFADKRSDLNILSESEITSFLLNGGYYDINEGVFRCIRSILFTLSNGEVLELEFSEHSFDITAEEQLRNGNGFYFELLAKNKALSQKYKCYTELRFEKPIQIHEVYLYSDDIFSEDDSYRAVCPKVLYLLGENLECLLIRDDDSAMFTLVFDADENPQFVKYLPDGIAETLFESSMTISEYDE